MMWLSDFFSGIKSLPKRIKHYIKFYILTGIFIYRNKHIYIALPINRKKTSRPVISVKWKWRITFLWFRPPEDRKEYIEKYNNSISRIYSYRHRSLELYILKTGYEDKLNFKDFCEKAKGWTKEEKEYQIAKREFLLDRLMNDHRVLEADLEIINESYMLIIEREKGIIYEFLYMIFRNDKICTKITSNDGLVNFWIAILNSINLDKSDHLLTRRDAELKQVEIDPFNQYLADRVDPVTDYYYY